MDASRQLDVLQPQLEVVYRGTAHEAGYEIGEALQSKILAAQVILEQYEAFRLKQPWWMPYSLYRYLAEWQARSQLEASFRAHYPALAERIDGMAGGAGVTTDSLYLFHAFEAVMTSLECIELAPMAACTAVALRGQWTADEQPVVAHNFDNLPLLQPLFALRENQGHGFLHSLQFTFAPLSGTVDGINEAGLCITYDYAMTTDSRAPNPPISFAIEEALSTCHNVEEAISRIRSVPRCGGGILMLADAEGDMASIELSSTRSNVRRPNAERDMLTHSNQFCTARMKEIEVPEDAVYGQQTPQALRGRRVLQSAESRDRRLSTIFNQPERLGMDEIAQRMADHGDDGQPNCDTVCMHGEHWRTTACIQLLPVQRTMRIAYGAACEVPSYVEFTL